MRPARTRPEQSHSALHATVQAWQATHLRRSVTIAYRATRLLRLTPRPDRRTKFTRIPVPPVSGSTLTRLISELSDAPRPNARLRARDFWPKPWTM